MSIHQRFAPSNQAPEISLIDEFVECCEQHRWFVDSGILAWQIAVDNLQWLAERWGLVDALGQDEVQAIMCSAFASADMSAAQERTVADIVRGLELADPRDRWRHNGDAPPLPEVRSGPLQPAPPTARLYRTPQATIDAFWCVARIGDPDYLARWLAQHPRDAQNLHRLWEAKCLIAAA